MIVFSVNSESAGVADLSISMQFKNRVFVRKPYSLIPDYYHKRDVGRVNVVAVKH